MWKYTLHGKTAPAEIDMNDGFKLEFGRHDCILHYLFKLGEFIPYLILTRNK